MLMKMHAFMRTICGRTIQRRLETATDEITLEDCHLPGFGKYMYYLFAPTFIYRDNYPRTNAVRWKFVGARFLEAVAITFLLSFIFELQIKPYFRDFGKMDLPAGSFVGRMFAMLVPSTIILLAGFYFLLHAWLNFTAELLRFGDRLYYRDWWNSGNYDGYFRNWNIVVSDWFYEYVYKEIGIHFCKGSKNFAMMMVYLISALLHEYVLIFALQIFFPVMFVMFFGLATLFIYLTRHVSQKVGNMFLWFTILYGNALMITLYCMEFYTSRNCPKESYDSWSDILVPHLWSCYIK